VKHRSARTMCAECRRCLRSRHERSADDGFNLKKADQPRKDTDQHGYQEDGAIWAFTQKVNVDSGSESVLQPCNFAQRRPDFPRACCHPNPDREPSRFAARRLLRTPRKSVRPGFIPSAASRGRLAVRCGCGVSRVRFIRVHPWLKLLRPISTAGLRFK
jgi:hypothetical protein